MSAPTQQHLERAEQYLRGAMSEQERYAFLQDLERDEQLRTALRLMDKIAVEISNAQTVPTTNRFIRFPRRLIPLAAVILLLLMAAIVWDVVSTKPSNTQLFDEYYSPYPTDIITRSTKGPDQVDPQTEIDLEAYQAGQWEQAESDLRTYLQTDSSNTTMKFFLAQTILARKGVAPDEAIQILKAITRENTGFQNLAEWYLALAYLKSGQTQLAALALEQILEDENHSKRQSALELLNMLKK